jgi:hypothetical protein
MDRAVGICVSMDAEDIYGFARCTESISGYSGPVFVRLHLHMAHSFYNRTHSRLRPLQASRSILVDSRCVARDRNSSR